MSFEEELNLFDENPFYTKTNESLVSIIHGLGINSNSSILSICGSGDQAFAMISKGARVVAIDYDLRQINLVNKKIDYIKSNNYFEFIKSEYGAYDSPRIDSRRNLFFYNHFDKLRQNLKNLELILEPIDMVEYIINSNISKFNSFYFSNIFSNSKIFKDKLGPSIKKIKIDSKLYLTQIDEEDLIFEEGLEYDLISSEIAKNSNHIELWSPQIYRRV